MTAQSAERSQTASPVDEQAFLDGKDLPDIEAVKRQSRAERHVGGRVEFLDVGQQETTIDAEQHGVQGGGYVQEDAVRNEEAVSGKRRLLETIVVSFKHNYKLNEEEFCRQLKLQETGKNNLTIEEYLNNRKHKGRSSEERKARRRARKQAYEEKRQNCLKMG